MSGTIFTQIYFLDTQLMFNKIVLLPINQIAKSKVIADELTQYLRQCQEGMDDKVFTTLNLFKTRIYTVAAIHNTITSLVYNNGLNDVSIPINYLYDKNVVLCPVGNIESFRILLGAFKNILDSNKDKESSLFYQDIKKLLKISNDVFDVIKFGGKVSFMSEKIIA